MAAELVDERPSVALARCVSALYWTLWRCVLMLFCRDSIKMWEKC